MIKAGFISSSPDWHWSRQFPDSNTTWDGVSFQFHGNFNDCDIVFVYDGIPNTLCGRIAAKRAVFIASEPTNVKVYRADFLSQFDLVLTTDRMTQHPNVEIGQVGLPWHVGVWDSNGNFLKKPMTLDDFLEFKPLKSKLISVVSSNKAFTPEHRSRLEFVDKLKSYFGSEMDYFGRNINGFGDKSEVLSHYKYHVAIENCQIQDYWTEKVSDPLLTLTYPIYHGCTNIEKYLPDGSFTPIDISDSETAISAIRKVIDADIYERTLPRLEQARIAILYHHNLFALLSKTAKKIVRSPLKTKSIESERFFKKHNRSARFVLRSLRSMRLKSGI